MDGIFLSTPSVAALSKNAREEVLAIVVGQQTAAFTEETPDSVSENPADISYLEAREMLEGCGDKIRKALQVMVKYDKLFTMHPIADALGVDLNKSDLRGVWAGLTKRTRRIKKDPKAILIWWDLRGDEWYGRFSKTTHESLKRALGV